MAFMIQAEKVKRWAMNELRRPLYSLPSDHYFRLLCAGPWKVVWMYLTDHVYQRRNVKIIRGNLRWYEVRLSKEARQKLADKQRDAVKKKKLREKIQLLKAEIASLDSRIQEPEKVVARQVQSRRSMWAKMKNCKFKEIIVKAFWQHCYFNRKTFTEYAQKISRKCDALELLVKNTSFDVMFYLELSDHRYIESLGELILQPQVLREAIKLRDNFLQISKQNLQSTILAAKKNDEPQTVDFTQWVNDVQKVCGDYPPNHIIAVLTQLSLKEKLKLQQKKASLDQKTGSTAQRLHFERDHRLDKSTEVEKDRPSVKTLLEDAWKKVTKIWAALARARARVQRLKNQFESCKKEAQRKISDKFPNDSSALLAVRKPLHWIMCAEIRDHIEEFSKELKQSIERDQGEDQSFHLKWFSVMLCESKVMNKHKQIKDLIKMNWKVKIQIAHFHAELRKLIHTRLVLLIKAIITAVRFLKISLLKVPNRVARISLSSLDCRNVEGGKRIAASQLSIRQTGFSQKLKFPPYKAPGELWAKLRFRKREMRHRDLIAQRIHKYMQKVIKKAMWLGSLENDFMSNMEKKDFRRLKKTVRKTRTIACRCGRTLSIVARLKSAIIVWKSLPAQYANPRKCQKGKTYTQWIKRWMFAILRS